MKSSSYHGCIVSLQIVADILYIHFFVFSLFTIMGHVVCLCSFFIEIFHFVPYRPCIMDNQLGFQNKRQLNLIIFYETKSTKLCRLYAFIPIFHHLL